MLHGELKGGSGQHCRMRRAYSRAASSAFQDVSWGGTVVEAGVISRVFSR